MKYETLPLTTNYHDDCQGGSLLEEGVQLDGSVIFFNPFFRSVLLEAALITLSEHMLTFVNIFFLFDCTRPLRASSAPFTDKGKLRFRFYCSDFKYPKCFYNEILAFYLNLNTC